MHLTIPMGGAVSTERSGAGHVSRMRRSRGPVQSGLFIPLPGDWRTCILPVIGLATPVGLLVVNFSAWVISQLGAFRWGVAVSAFRSEEHTSELQSRQY